VRGGKGLSLRLRYRLLRRCSEVNNAAYQARGLGLRRLVGVVVDKGVRGRDLFILLDEIGRKKGEVDGYHKLALNTLRPCPVLCRNRRFET
jgi:hypothetical protein